MTPEDMTVHVRVVDHASPILHGLARRLWLYSNVGRVIVTMALMILLLVAALAFTVGRITA